MMAKEQHWKPSKHARKKRHGPSRAADDGVSNFRVARSVVFFRVNSASPIAAKYVKKISLQCCIRSVKSRKQERATSPPNFAPHSTSRKGKIQLDVKCHPFFLPTRAGVMYRLHFFSSLSPVAAGRQRS